MSQTARLRQLLALQRQAEAVAAAPRSPEALVAMRRLQVAAIRAGIGGGPPEAIAERARERVRALLDAVIERAEQREAEALGEISEQVDEGLRRERLRNQQWASRERARARAGG